MFKQIESFLTENIGEISRAELTNTDSVHLYAMGEYWLCFDRSAYLYQNIDDSVDIQVLTLVGYPFPLIMGVIGFDRIIRLSGIRTSKKISENHIQIKTTSLDKLSYEKWRREEIEILVGE